jgi:hypothetical protein
VKAQEKYNRQPRKIYLFGGFGSSPVRLREAAFAGLIRDQYPYSQARQSPHYRRNNIMIRKENLLDRRRQLCQDMGRMAWPDEAWAARDEIMTIDDELAG